MVDLAAVLVSELVNRLYADPLAAIASGVLLLIALPADAANIRQALEQAGIPCADVGEVHAGDVAVYRDTASDWAPLP